jgi:hypothetical protein
LRTYEAQLTEVDDKPVLLGCRLLQGEVLHDLDEALLCQHVVFQLNNDNNYNNKNNNNNNNNKNNNNDNNKNSNNYHTASYANR